MSDLGFLHSAFYLSSQSFSKSFFWANRRAGFESIMNLNCYVIPQREKSLGMLSVTPNYIISLMQYYLPRERNHFPRCRNVQRSVKFKSCKFVLIWRHFHPSWGKNFPFIRIRCFWRVPSQKENNYHTLNTSVLRTLCKKLLLVSASTLQTLPSDSFIKAFYLNFIASCSA